MRWSSVWTRQTSPWTKPVRQAGTYVFRANNVGNVVHSLAIEGQETEEETPNIQPGESSQLKVNLDPGTYKLYCPVGNQRRARPGGHGHGSSELEASYLY